MKIRWWLLIFLVLGLLLGPKIQQYPGFVIVAFNQTTLQIPLWLSTFILIILIFVIFQTISILKNMILKANKAQKWNNKRKWSKSRLKTISGLLSLIEGRWEDSEKQMIQAMKHGDTPLINLLVAAQAVNNAGNYTKRDEYLEKAKKFAKHEDVIIGMSQIQLQIEAKQYQKAFDDIQILRKNKTKSSYLDVLEIKVSKELKNWNNIIKLVPKIKKSKQIINDEIDDFYVEAAIKIIEESKKDELTTFYQSLPNRHKSNIKIIKNYSKKLIANNQHTIAEKTLQKTLKTTDDFEIIELFSKIKSSQPGKQLDIIESKLQTSQHRQQIINLLCDLCIHLKIWGKAKKYLELSILGNQSVEKKLQLIGVLTRLGETDSAQKQKNALLELIN